MRDLQEELKLTYLFITHNLAVVDYVADNIAVMCQGRLVEMAPRESLFKSPIHPYTRALMAAVPFADLHHPLDFEALMDGRMSDPAAWPGPFAVGPSTSQGTSLDFIEVDNEHFVLASSGSSGEQVLRSVS
jgi:peptide/nickel transport system ATP-binding protein